MHLHAILAHLILLPVYNSLATIPSPAKPSDIFSKLNPCMVTDVLVSVPFGLICWGRRTQNSWTVLIVICLKDCNPGIEKCVHCDIDSTGQILKFCVKLETLEGSLCDVKKHPGCKCGPGIYQQYDEPWVSPIRVLIDPTLNPSCYTDAVRRVWIYRQLWASFSCIPWFFSNVFWVYRTAKLEIWANHVHLANLQKVQGNYALMIGKAKKIGSGVKTLGAHARGSR